MEQIQQRAQIRQQTLQIHALCWEKCVPGTPGTKSIGNGSDRSADACFENCTKRFLESSKVVIGMWSK